MPSVYSPVLVDQLRRVMLARRRIDRAAIDRAGTGAGLLVRASVARPGGWAMIGAVVGTTGGAVVSRPRRTALAVPCR
jgi:hypothetical protein